MRRTIMAGGIVLGVLALAGCDTVSSLTSGVSSPFSGSGSLRGAANEINGTRFRTRVASSRDDPRAFVTTTRGAGRNVTGAVEAGRVEAVGHCLATFGGSDIVWAQGPDRPIELVSLDASGALVLSGRCVTR